MSDTTPQDQAVAALVEKFQPDSAGRIALEPARDPSGCTAATSTGPGLLDFRYLTFGEIVECLAEAGLLTDHPPPKACDEVALIEEVARKLADFRLRLGPKTRQFVVDGQESIPLSGSERHEVAHAAVSALPHTCCAERGGEADPEEVVHEVARAIRDAYEQLPDGSSPEFTNVSDWYGEARAALSALREQT